MIIPIEVEVDGVIHKGSRELEGKRKIFQTVFYKLEREVDTRAYQPPDESKMLAWAMLSMFELIKRSKARDIAE